MKITLTDGNLPDNVSINKQIDSEKQEKIIAENHAADVQNGLSENQASESDAFERRVLGMDDPEEVENHDGPTFHGGRCTRCKRTSDYCEC